MVYLLCYVRSDDDFGFFFSAAAAAASASIKERAKMKKKKKQGLWEKHNDMLIEELWEKDHFMLLAINAEAMDFCTHHYYNCS